MAISVPRPLCVLMLACLLVAVATRTASGITCDQVLSYVSPCVNYARNGGTLPPSCCDGVRGLKSAASTTPLRREMCDCMKKLLNGVSGIKPPLIEGIPGKCGVSIGYPISPSVDCSKVQ